MRISEWSSDVCSSDLVVGVDPVQVVAALYHGRGAVFGRRYARAALAHDGAVTGGQDEQRQRGQARDEDAGRGYSGTFRRDHASCGSPVGPTAATHLLRVKRSSCQPLPQFARGHAATKRKTVV